MLVVAENVSVELYHADKFTVANKSNNSEQRVLFFKGVTQVQALRDISFVAEEGDRIGLIGKNGSGKTTLIRLLAGHLTHSSGRLEIGGCVTPQISMGSGIKSNLSGRENAEMKCLYFGVDEEKRNEYLDKIRHLSGLDEFFDLPISTYSQGMRGKLIMSLLTILGGDILVMDEWIGTISHSDQISVQQSALDSFRTVFLATHSEKIIRNMTNKCLWLDDGRVKGWGKTETVLEEYNLNN